MLNKILEKCKNRKNISMEEIEYLLSQTEKEKIEQIFAAAREMRESVFNNKVFLYGFVYFSTYCKNNCTFCYYRKENQQPPRYRKSLEEVVATAVELKESGVHLIDLTTGDDPYYTDNYINLADTVKAVKDATGLAVMVSPGLLDEHGIKAIKEAGADWYALYQETHNKSLFKKLRQDQSYAKRMYSKEYAGELGMLVEEGLLTGVGETLKDRADSFMEMKRINASQVRSMTFVPQDGIPLKLKGEIEYNNELINIAVMRLLFPEELIPASLDVEGLEGLEKRLNAGANVVTSIIPPRQGYAGVANFEHDINEGYRTVKGIQDTLKKCKLENATAKEYCDWVKEKIESNTANELINIKCS